MLSANSNSTSKFTVEEIDISTEQMQELARNLKRAGSHTSKYRLIRDVAGGNCSYCYVAIPVKKVSYDLDGGKLVEWFCDPCWEKHKSEINNRIKNMRLGQKKCEWSFDSLTN